MAARRNPEGIDPIAMNKYKREMKEMSYGIRLTEAERLDRAMNHLRNGQRASVAFRWGARGAIAYVTGEVRRPSDERDAVYLLSGVKNAVVFQRGEEETANETLRPFWHLSPWDPYNRNADGYVVGVAHAGDEQNPAAPFFHAFEKAKELAS